MKGTVDFVLPWVDPSDLKWRESRALYEKLAFFEDSQFDLKHYSDANYRDLDILKYVLRGVERHCPWYRRIHIITCGHSPDWLNFKHPKINIVSHDSLYFDKSDLPTFNSSSIEMNLGNIKGCADKLIYLNDDTLIIEDVDERRFFINNKPVDFLIHGWIPRGRIYKYLRHSNAWISSLNNSVKLINENYKTRDIGKDILFENSYGWKNIASNILLKYIWGKYYWFAHWHHPQPYLLLTLQSTRQLYSQAMSRCSANKFRSHDDLTHYLYRYRHLAKGDFFPKYFDDGLVGDLKHTSNLENVYRKLDIRKHNGKPYKFLCLNDNPTLSLNEFIDIKHSVNRYLGLLFPHKACFER